MYDRPFPDNVEDFEDEEDYFDYLGSKKNLQSIATDAIIAKVAISPRRSKHVK
jgi:hypothetical protein